MDEIPRGVAGKYRALITRGKRATPPDMDAAGRAERAGMRIGRGDIRADRKELHAVASALEACFHAAFRAVLHGFAESQAWIAREPFRGKHHVLDRQPVHTDEPAPVGVER